MTETNWKMVPVKVGVSQNMFDDTLCEEWKGGSYEVVKIQCNILLRVKHELSRSINISKRRGGKWPGYKRNE